MKGTSIYYVTLFCIHVHIKSVWPVIWDQPQTPKQETNMHKMLLSKVSSLAFLFGKYIDNDTRYTKSTNHMGLHC